MTENKNERNKVQGETEFERASVGFGSAVYPKR